MTLLGTVQTPPSTRSGPQIATGTHVWHAYDGWSPLDELEIERWLVDAPTGAHWLLSERRLRIEKKAVRSGVTYDIWGPDRFAEWLGQAVLNGDLNATVPTHIVDAVVEEETERAPVQVFDGPVALRPSIELHQVLDRHGLRAAEARPVLLCGRIWSVQGILRGPEDAAERQQWQLLEDPFTSEIDHLGSAESLDFIPSLARIEPPVWLEEAEIAPQLATMCEERRHYTVTESSGASQVQGSVLHWWKLDPSSAEMTPRLALLPAWQVRIPDRGVALVHGLTGQLLPMP